MLCPEVRQLAIFRPMPSTVKWDVCTGVFENLMHGTLGPRFEISILIRLFYWDGQSRQSCGRYILTRQTRILSDSDHDGFLRLGRSAERRGGEEVRRRFR